MNELQKIQEAEYFLTQLAQGQDNLATFKFKLSAFLTAARTVLQYALAEARPKSGGQVWYARRFAKSTVCQFFNDKRDINIHIHFLTVHLLNSL
jgi:hypothetical protein